MHGKQLQKEHSWESPISLVNFIIPPPYLTITAQRKLKIIISTKNIIWTKKYTIS